MSARLDRTTDLAQQARQANWCVNELAKLCKVSPRTLTRWFQETKGTPPHEWMQHERLSHAVELLLEGASVKETASRLGYKTQHHFSREFKKRYGYPPSEHFRHKQSGANHQLPRL